MSSKPRLSKRDSTAALRQDTLPPSTSGRKRSGSVASTTSRASLMFTNPARHFGLTRKASTATLSAAPVAVSTSGIDHTFDAFPTNNAGEGPTNPGGTDKRFPVRQATRAEDVLRSVKSRAPQASTLQPEPAPLSGSPASAPISLPGASNTLDTPSDPVLSSSPTNTDAPTLVSGLSQSKFASPSLAPGLQSLPSVRSVTNKEITITNKDTTETNKETGPPPPTPSTSPPAQPKFRTPSLTPEFGASRLTRKSSMSSVRTLDKDRRPVSPSPLSLHSSTPPTPAPTLIAPTPASTPVATPVALGSTSVPISGLGSDSPPINNTGTMSTSPGSSWLPKFRGIGRSSAPSPSPSRISREPKSDHPSLDDSAIAGTMHQRADVHDESEVGSQVLPRPSPVAPAQGAIAIVPPAPVLGSSTSPNGATATDGRTLTINTFAAQHAAAAVGNSPSGWLAWLTSTPSSRLGSSSPVLVGQHQIKGAEDDTVMYIDSDGEDGAETDAVFLDVNGLTPPMTPTAVQERQKGDWNNVKGKGKAILKQDMHERSEMDEAMPTVDNLAPTSSDVGENYLHATASVGVKPVSQNVSNLNAAALRYALQLPLLGRLKQQPSPQGKIGQSDMFDSQTSVQTSDAINHEHASTPETAGIVTKYSDEHDFVIIEIEVDGWILINTQGTVPSSPLTPTHTPAGRGAASGSSWWDYYMGGAHPGSTPLTGNRDGHTEPAAEMARGLSCVSDSDSRSVNSSLFSTVLRPFGRARETNDRGVSSEANHAAAASKSAGEGERPAKTQAELVKEEALARQSPSIVPVLPSPVLNTATKSSWVSYFSSKASRSTPVMSDGRAINQRAENRGEMEVMDINEDELSEPVEIHIADPPISTPISRAPGTTVPEKPAPPLTDSPSVKRQASVISQGKKSSASSSHSTKASLPNFVLPTFGDTFYTVPRCVPHHTSPSATAASNTTSVMGSWKLKRTVKNIATQFFNANTSEKAAVPYVTNQEMEEYQRQVSERRKLTNRANFATVQPAVPRSPNTPRPPRPGNVRSTSSFGSLAIDDFGAHLPRVFSVLGHGNALGDIPGPVRAVVIGVHGWFPGAIVRSVFGEPTGTSLKFATMGVEALRQFAEKQGLNLESVTPMPLEGEGTIERRVIKLYDDLLKHPQWLADLHRADVVFVATHSQGSIVSTHLIARLISDGHIRTRSNREAVNRATEHTGVIPPIAPHRVCCLAMCGIHMGPLYSLNSSSLAQPYLQWFESQAARELFEFQNTDSEVSRNYVAALSTALDHGTKFVYIASLNDQVVPIYSGTFVAASHPLILRGLFLDGDAYSSSDFLSNLLVLLLRVKNAGLDEHGLILHLSEATAGSLSGIGHSTAYEDLGPYSLAVRYMFETSGIPLDSDCKLSVDAFQARASRNDYEIPWLLHSLISDARINRIFSPELSELRDSFVDWKPVTAVLRDVQRKLAPIRMSPLRHSTLAEDTETGSPASKL